MSGLNAKKIKNQGNFVKQNAMDEGTYPCRVVQVIDMGVQKQRPYQGQAKPPAHCLRITYEFLDEFCYGEDGEEQLDKPRWLSEEFPLRSMESDLAKSTKRYKAIDPKDESDGDFTQLIGKPVLITVVNNESKGNVYNNIGAATTMRKRDADKAVELVNEPLIMVLDEADTDAFGKLPTWLQDKIKEGIEFESTPMAEALGMGDGVSSGGDDEEEEDGKW